MQGFFNLFGVPPLVPQGGFEQTYRCYSVAMCERHHLESGGKIILPPSALQQLANLQVTYPLLFRLSNPSRERPYTHAGVLEFVAPEGYCYLPFWMMNNLGLSEGNLIQVKNVTLRSGTFVKLQPHFTTFLDLSDPRAVLEKSLRDFSALTEGDIIPVRFNGKVYPLNILEVSSTSQTSTSESNQNPSENRNPRAVSIVETDVQVDFAPPLDYKPPSVAQPIRTPVSSPSPSSTSSTTSNTTSSTTSNTTPETPTQENDFSAFSGQGFRLDGKPIRSSSKPSLTSTNTSSTTQSPKPTSSTPTPSLGRTSSPSTNSTQVQIPKNKMVFGRSEPTNPPSTSTSTTTPSTSSSSSDSSTPAPNFVPFSGKGYSLQ